MASHDAVEGVAPSEKPAFVDEKDRDDQDHIARLKAKDRLLQGAKAATENEQNMTLMQGIRLYPKAIAWSILISTCIVMEGYDVCLINNFCKSSFSPVSGAPKHPWAETDGNVADAFPQFKRKYGEQLLNGEWEVTAPWQAGLSNVSAQPSMTAVWMPGACAARSAPAPVLAPGFRLPLT
jgi:MFS transporter, SP family, general alpha glucoside:H+ symporter